MLQFVRKVVRDLGQAHIAGALVNTRVPEHHVLDGE
jgi:hypothetical protein